MIGPKGKFMLQPDDDRTHIFISSGTGNAPFVSMMRQLLIDGRPRPVVFLNGVSYANELGYRERARGLGARRASIRSRSSRPCRAPTTRATPAGWAGPAVSRRSWRRCSTSSA